MRSRAAAALILSILHFSACGGTPRPAVSPLPRADPAVLRLQRSIDALLAAPVLDHATSAVLVRSLTRGDTLYSANPRRLLMPASALKLVTLAAAADRLGWDYAYETRLLAVGDIRAGTLDGDLLVVGSGDPSIDDWDGSATGLFRDWADRLKSLGVSAVNGRIVGDDNAFDDDQWGSGWAWDDLSSSFATGIGALQFNENSARLNIRPGREIGDPAEVTIAPSSSGIVTLSTVTTSVPDVPPSVITHRLPGSNALDVRGTIPAMRDPLFRIVSVDNSTQYFVTALRDALIANGIEVHGSAVDIDALQVPPVRDQASPLLVHRSPPLSTLAVTMMKNSQNLYAETLLKSLGAAGGTGTVDAGRAVVSTALQAWGVTPDSIVLADGSGLSRYNLATVEALVAVLTAVYRDDRLREPFEATLPIAGRDGTLARRLNGTPAEGIARAKTGSLSDARSLAGYVQTTGGEPLAFCIIVNNFGSAAATVEQTMDAILVKLAELGPRR